MSENEQTFVELSNNEIVVNKEQNEAEINTNSPINKVSNDMDDADFMEFISADSVPEKNTKEEVNEVATKADITPQAIENFEISFTNENLSLAGEDALFPKYSTLFNNVFATLYIANLNISSLSSTLLDSKTGLPTTDNKKWETAYALQVLNSGINPDKNNIIKKKLISNNNICYYYDSNNDGEYEYEIGFDENKNPIHNKLINKSEHFKNVQSVTNVKNSCLTITTKDCEISETCDDKHYIQAGKNKVEIEYNEDGTVASLICDEACVIPEKEENIFETKQEETKSFILSEDKAEKTDIGLCEDEDNALENFLANEENKEESKEITDEQKSESKEESEENKTNIFLDDDILDISEENNEEINNEENKADNQENNLDFDLESLADSISIETESQQTTES